MAMLTVQGTESVVRIDRILSHKFGISSGLTQGDLLSPLLFNFALEAVVRGVSIRSGGTIYNRSAQILAYADDVVLIGRNHNSAKQVCIELMAEAERFGLHVNENKTKYMVTTAKNHSPIMQNMVVGEMNFEAVESFKYLGTLINRDNVVSAEIEHRISQGNKDFFALLRLFKSRSLSRNTKLKIYKTVIRPVILYGCEA
ncbi:hypothetical protein DMENIID0001_125290 [Sergentomyia squamirostris]